MLLPDNQLSQYRHCKRWGRDLASIPIDLAAVGCPVLLVLGATLALNLEEAIYPVEDNQRTKGISVLVFCLLRQKL